MAPTLKLSESLFFVRPLLREPYFLISTLENPKYPYSSSNTNPIHPSRTRAAQHLHVSQVYLIHSTRVHLAATALAPWKNKVQWMSHLDSEPNKTTANFYTSASGKEPPVAAPPPSYALGLPPPPRTKDGTAATHRRHRHEAHPRIRIRRPLRPSPRKYEGATTELRRSGGAGAGGDADGDAIASQNKQSRTCYARRQGPALKVAYVSVE